VFGSCGPAVCGKRDSNITVIDQLTGGLDGCYVSTLSFEQLLLDPGNVTQCTGPLFGETCGTFFGNIDIVYFPATSSLTPDTLEFLRTLGLADINAIGGNLRIFVTGLQGLGTIAPNLFTGLLGVAGNLSVADDAVPPAITSIGGLTSLVQVILSSLSDLMRPFNILTCT
jgi:hypothetical protein